MEEEEDRVLTRFDDWAYLSVQSTKAQDNWWTSNFKRHHAEWYAMQELACSKTKAKRIVRNSLTLTGGVENYQTCNGTFIHREMFERFIAELKRCEEREAEEKERSQSHRSARRPQQRR